MTFFEILVEGRSDEPVIREVLTRKFGLREGTHFNIHPHKGRGRLPTNILARPDPKQQTLLHQLPAKLRAYGAWMNTSNCVLVIIDTDDSPCVQLLTDLKAMLERLPKKPQRVLFRLAIEETESWFIADENAILRAYPRAKLQKIKNIAPDSIIGAWELLAETIDGDRSGADKKTWAEAICPYLDLDTPRSPSLAKLIEGIDRELSSSLGSN